MSKKIKVLCIDDSALIRQMLTKILDSDSEIEVVGTAQDPIIARDKIKTLSPDVITLDAEMPRMDGLTPRHSADVILEKGTRVKHLKTTEQIIAIGASTGGTEAIKEVLNSMPANAPGIVISQHIPKEFSAPFAKRMNQTSAMTVSEAVDGQQILPGNVYIAPGSHHLLVVRSGARYICRLNEGPPVNRHRPSVDVMFRSVVQNVGANAIGVILTGMGNDGANGMLELHDIGCHCIAQDEKSSVVWGMPGEAVKLNAVDDILPLNKIAQKLMKVVNKQD